MTSVWTDVKVKKFVNHAPRATGYTHTHLKETRQRDIKHIVVAMSCKIVATDRSIAIYMLRQRNKFSLNCIRFLLRLQYERSF